MFGLRGPTTKTNALLENRGESSTDGDDFLANEREATESGFLRRLIHRNSKRSIARANDGVEDTDSSQSVAKKLQISTSCLEAAAREPLQVPDKSRFQFINKMNFQAFCIYLFRFYLNKEVMKVIIKTRYMYRVFFLLTFKFNQYRVLKK